MEQSFIVVHRKFNGEEKIYPIGNDFSKAIRLQKALLVTDNITDEVLALVGSMITPEDIDNVIRNLDNTRYYRVCSDEEEAYIFFMPKRDAAN